MGLPPLPTPVLLAIPATCPPSNPSPLPSNSVPLPLDPELAPQTKALPGSAPAPPAPPAGQIQAAALPSSVKHSSARQLPAAPPAATPAAPPPASSSAPHAAPAPATTPSSAFPPLFSGLSKSPTHAEDLSSAHPADLQIRPQPVRQNAKANPLHPKSYAQAAKGSPGPGFVRAHARDVDSFARLPRTGINVIRGSHEGIPSFAFVQSELPKVEGLYAKALVMKFHGGRPSLAASHKEISNWGLESTFSIGPLISRSFLLRFQDERDLLKSLTRPSSTLINFPYNIFRWHNRCHIREDSCTVPIWISLPRLPLQCFAPEFLESIANTIGRFLCLDKATATLARPSEARMCIELDLRKERLQFIWIDLFDGFKQPIVYERVPKFCSGCHVQGHTYVECSKTSLDTLPSQDSGTIPTFQERTHPVRRNAKEHLAATPLVNASVFPQQHPPDPFQHQPLPPPISPVIPSSMQQCDPPPHPPAPSSPAMLDAAQFQTAVHPILQSTAAAHFQSAVHPVLQSTVASESHPTFPPPTPIYEAISSSYPSPAAAVPTPDSSVMPSTQQPTRTNIPTAPQPPVQSSISVALQQQLHQSPATAKASSPSYSFPEVAVPPVSSEPHPAAAPPLSSEVKQVASEQPPAAARPSAQDRCPAAALPHIATNPPPVSVLHPSPDVQPGGTHSSGSAPAVALSDQVAPFSPSSSMQQPSTLNNQHPSSSSRAHSTFHNVKVHCVEPPESHPNHAFWEMLQRKIGERGGILVNAPTPSYLPHQNHHFEGLESEGSFETDSQQNSPLESPHKDVHQCLFPPQSCVSEGDELTEDPPGFQGHISDVDFYHRPRSSKKNKRQPDGPLRVQLRTRKGPSSHK